ncbi:hypothetical protein PBPRA2163 [Photobacterium profundum SS9]|uniref:Uncharacterized protein n=1 Tax=Photobacterium profundum (strain SS9) TaxID=298386 RepID=Q6LQ65_PHOPR|nr:hypothetical protein PBPRA2163 [Photobacterium profundum SS9]
MDQVRSITFFCVNRGLVNGYNQTAYSIYQVNWECYFQSYVGINVIKRKKMEELAYRQAVKHQSSPKEYAFWKAIYMGCKI